jgi:hypothetical protein
MGRAWRIEFEGALYHILSRGNERKGIFYDDKDRYMFLKAIGEMPERFGIDIFAYVLMENPAISLYSETFILLLAYHYYLHHSILLDIATGSALSPTEEGQSLIIDDKTLPQNYQMRAFLSPCRQWNKRPWINNCL